MPAPITYATMTRTFLMWHWIKVGGYYQGQVLVKEENRIMSEERHGKGIFVLPGEFLQIGYWYEDKTIGEYIKIWNNGDKETGTKIRKDGKIQDNAHYMVEHQDDVQEK